MEETTSSHKCSVSDGIYQITTCKTSSDNPITTRNFYCYNQNFCKLLTQGKCPHKH